MGNKEPKTGSEETGLAPRDYQKAGVTLGTTTGNLRDEQRPWNFVFQAEGAWKRRKRRWEGEGDAEFNCCIQVQEN